MNDIDPTERWQLNHSQEKLENNDCDFLDSTELKGIIKAAEFAMLLFTRDQAPKEIFNAAADLNESAQKFQKSGAPEDLGELFEMAANLRLLESIPAFSEERKRYVQILIQRLHAFLDSQIYCVSGQGCSTKGLEGICFENRIKAMKNTLRSNSLLANYIRLHPTEKDRLEAAHRAYKFGQNLLQSKAFREDLKDIRALTRNDSLNYEFSFTGNSKLRDRRTSDFQRGFKNETGPKHANVQYNAGDDFACHSHSKDDALSVNNDDNLYGIAGDIPHVIATQKSLCTITPSGDIYFTTPELVDCAKADREFGQVYLGNIKDFDK